MGGRGVLANDATPRPTVAEQMQTTQPIDAAYLRAAGIAGGGGFVGGYPISQQQAVRGAVTGAQMGIEGGATIAGQAAGLPGGPVGVMGGGNLGARFGNYLSQGLEYAIYGKPYSQEENEKAALMGSVPMVGAEELAAQRMAQSGLMAVKPEKTMLEALESAARTGTKFGAAGAATEALVGTAYSPNYEIPSYERMAGAALGPMALGTMAQFLQDKGSSLVDRAGQALNAYNFYRKQGITPTPGLLDPKRYAAIEQQIINQQPLGSTATQVENLYQAVSQNLEDIAPSSMQGSTMFERMKDKMTGIAESRKKLDELGPKVQSSQLEADKALADLNKTKEQYFADQTSAANKALDDTINEAVARARTDAVNAATRGQAGVRPDISRDAAANMAKTVDDAYKTHWQRMYAPFPDKDPIFDTEAIFKQAEGIYNEYMGEGKMPASLKARLGGTGEEPSFRASLNSLRELRDTLLDKGKFESTDSSLMEGELKRLAGTITSELDRQVPSAFGDPALVDQFLKVNKDFANYANLRKAPGVDLILQRNPQDSMVSNVVAAIEKNGAGADEFKNFRSFIANLAKPQQAVKDFEAAQYVTPTSAATINPELASKMAQHYNDIIRGNVLWQSSRGGKVDPELLISRLNKIGNDPEALKLLGFGTQDQVAELTQLFKKHPLASKMTPDEWSQLFSSPTFQQSLEKGGKLTDLLKKPMQISDLQNQMGMIVRLQQAGRADLAEKIYQDALKNAEDLKIERSQLADKLKAMEADPTYAIHKNVKIEPANYYDLISKTTDTNIVNSSHLKAIAESLRKSPLIADKELLAAWQRGYIKQRLMVDEGSRINVNRVSDIFGGINPRKMVQEMDVANAILDPKQVKEIEELARVVNRMRSYETASTAEKEKISKLIKSSYGRGYLAMVDMLKRREYDQVATALMNPDEYRNKVAFNGQWLQTAGKTLETMAPSGTRLFLPSNQQQQQAPSSVLRFAQPQPSR